MTITYPLAMPTAPVAKAITFKPKFAVASTESPFTFQQEIFEHQGQCWIASVQLPPMPRALAEAWVAWGLALNGSVGTFTMGDPVGKAAQGTPTGTPKIKGAGQQASKSIVTDGWTANTLILKAGDYIQLGTNLHKVLQNVTSSSTGEATIDIFPRVRDALTDNADIVVANTKGTWRMAGNGFSWDIGEAQIYGISFECREAL